MDNQHIEKYIGKGVENAITLAELELATGMNARKIRMHIAEARKHGVPIVNAQDGNGYFIPTPKELDKALAQHRQEKSRAMKILASNKGLAKWIADVQAGRITE